jgi:hypothetical protein
MYGDTCLSCADIEICDECCFCELENESVEEFMPKIPVERLGM